MNVVISSNKENPPGPDQFSTKNYNFSLHEQHPTSIYKEVKQTALRNFFITPEPLKPACNFTGTHQNIYKLVEKSTPKTVKCQEHLIKLILYSSLNEFLKGLTKKQSLCLLAGSLGKGLMKHDSDLDLVMIPGDFTRPKNAYTHFFHWWKAIGKEDSLEHLVEIDKNGERLLKKFKNILFLLYAFLIFKKQMYFG